VQTLRAAPAHGFATTSSPACDARLSSLVYERGLL
jgi:hypothetical protein